MEKVNLRAARIQDSEAFSKPEITQCYLKGRKEVG